MRQFNARRLFADLVDGTSRTSIAAFIVLSTLVLFLKRTDAFTNPQFWAEDMVFLIAAEKAGVQTLTTPQAGYLHTVPRMIALAARSLDPARQPGLFVFSSLGVTIAVGCSLLSKRLPLPNKFLIAAGLILAPNAGEVFFNPTNLQWILALGILGTALKDDPRSGADWMIDFAFLIVGGLSGPMILFSLPIFAYRTARDRTHASGVRLAAATLASAIQLWFILRSPPDTEFTGPFSAFDLAASISFRLVCAPFLGVLTSGPLPKLAAVVIGLVIMAFIVRGATHDNPHRTTLLFALCYLTLLLGASAARKRMDLWGYGDLLNGERYFFAPKVVLFWTVAVIAVSGPKLSTRWTAWALIASCLILNVPRFRFHPYEDLNWYGHCAEIRADHTVIVDINPGWRFRYHRGAPNSEGPLPAGAN